MAFLPFFFFAIGLALSYSSRQAQHLCLAVWRRRGSPNVPWPHGTTSQHERCWRGEAIRRKEGCPDAAEAGAKPLRSATTVRRGVGTGTKTRPAAWADAWLTSKERFLLASVSYVPLGREA